MLGITETCALADSGFPKSRAQHRYHDSGLVSDHDHSLMDSEQTRADGH